MLRALGREITAVTFDCWGTLLTFEPDNRQSRARRVAALADALRAAGEPRADDDVSALLTRAHQRHIDSWERAVATGSPEIARWALEPLGIDDPEILQTLTRGFEEAALAGPIPALRGAGETLQCLAERDVGLALVCDTGFTPGRVVRELLDREGLLRWLEILVFSDEAGMPKPHAPVFQTALRGLGAEPAQTLHVGDLRRTDIHGARELGMATIRIRDHNDDTTDLPDADAVANHHPHLLELLLAG
jgi:putative hydrolase of the HAD superfamily